MDGRKGRRGGSQTRGGYNLLDQARSRKRGRWEKRERIGACRTRTGESKGEEEEERKRGRAKERDGCLVSVSGKVVPGGCVYNNSVYEVEYRDRDKDTESLQSMSICH